MLRKEQKLQATTMLTNLPEEKLLKLDEALQQLEVETFEVEDIASINQVLAASTTSSTTSSTTKTG